MKKNTATFEQKRDCLVFMSRQEGDIPIRLEIITRNEYYKCGDNFYVIREFENRKKNVKKFKVTQKKLIQGNYLRFQDGNSISAFKVGKIKEIINSPSFSNTQIYCYDQFSQIVNYIRSLNFGISSDDAKDIAQEAFLSLSEISTKSSREFLSIWRRRCKFDILTSFRQKRVKCRHSDAEALRIAFHDRQYEIPIGNHLSNRRQKDVINAILRGYTITDIAELTNQSINAVQSVKDRALGKLKRMKL